MVIGKGGGATEGEGLAAGIPVATDAGAVGSGYRQSQLIAAGVASDDLQQRSAEVGVVGIRDCDCAASIKAHG